MRNKNFLRLAAVALSGVLAVLVGPSGAYAANAHALIQGSGSSWAANALNQWVADVEKQGLQIVYTANGAAQGRKDYANKSTDFGVTDSPYRGQDPTTGAQDDSLGRSFAYLPVVAGGTSFPYNVKVGGKAISNLRLSGETVAKIFTNKITNWNDPQISADNNGRKLPSIPIIPVVRADGAGVTNQFTTWLTKEYPSIWKDCNGKAAPTDYYPTNCGDDHGPQKAQTGSDGVMNYVKSDNAVGAIAMEEYSYPLNSGFPVAKLLNKAGYYTLPTQYNVAVALTAAEINKNPKDPNYLTQKLDKVYVNKDKRTYPLSSYVYAIIPTASNDKRLDSTAKRQTLADFLYYSICQGQSEIGPVGYSPLPINLVKAGFEQIAKLKKADPKVDLTQRDVSTCNNPTFIKGKPNVNHLAQIAPQPPECDKIGAAPCADGVGSSNANPGSTGGTKNGATGASGGTGAGSGTTGGIGGATPTAGAGPAGGTGGLVQDPVTGLLVPASNQGGAQAADAVIVPTTLAAGESDGTSTALTVLVIGLFFGAVITPVGVGRLIRRRGGQ